MPSSYLALEKAVQAQAKARMPPILSWREYSELAYLSRIDEEGDDLRTATALLHNLGSLVHFSNEEKVHWCFFFEHKPIAYRDNTITAT